MDVSAYEQNGVTNGYILYNQVVPVRRNNKWALFDIEGNKHVTDFTYDSFGCPVGKAGASRTYGVIEVFQNELLRVLLIVLALLISAHILSYKTLKGDNRF
jgi:hypothetical protein